VTTPTYVYSGTILADGRLTLVINGAALLQHILNQGQAASSLGMTRPPIGSVGFEFLAHCTSDELLSQIPILILSSRTGSKHRQLALKLGAAAYLTKPYSESQLLSTVSQILANQANLVHSA